MAADFGNEERLLQNFKNGAFKISFFSFLIFYEKADYSKFINQKQKPNKYGNQITTSMKKERKKEQGQRQTKHD